ncbi:MAG TPA: NAD(P)-binding protein, partial [Steroidobacteraceae bacterium]|nr:NAD(P)-binding protein [Steroidobacteraceae bacterium]
MSDRVDVAIVGAGAAGIAAGRRLSELRRSALLIEALPRAGGRARTGSFNGLDLDLGCGWMHSAKRNPLAALAEAQGQSLDRRASAWQRQFHNIHFPPEAQHAAWAAFRHLDERLH